MLAPKLFTSIFLLQGFMYQASAHVYLDYPYGGETFIGNTIITIEWHIAVPHEQLNWDLFYSTDGGDTWLPIQYDLPVSQLTYSWVVPNIATTTARISIIQDNVDMDYQDESMDFTIEPMPNTPFIDIPAQNLYVGCDVNNQQNVINQWLDNHGGAVAVGSCGTLIWTNDYAITNECGATGNAYVIFTAQDDCGSVSTGAYLNVYDLEAPLIETAASNLMVECDGSNNTLQLNNWLDNHGGAVATDACGNITWTNDYAALNNGCGMSGNATVTFIATDECGNSSATSATFSINDMAPPVIISQALQKIVHCGDTSIAQQLQAWLQSNGGATAIDACGSVTWMNNYEALSQTCGNTGNASVIFTAMDECGNTNITMADFIIRDDMAPRIIAPAKDTLIDCSHPDAKAILMNWLNGHGGSEAVDECGFVAWTNNFPHLIDTCDMPGSITVTFTAIDECGNLDSTTATVTLSAITNILSGMDNYPVFKISPNPARDYLKIELDNITLFPVHFILSDAFGRIYISRPEYGNEFYCSVNEYSPGIYFVQIHSSQRNLVKQILIK